MKGFVLEKFVGKLTGRNSAATRQNLGRTNLGLRQSCSARDTSLWEGEMEAIIITNDPLIEGVNLHQHLHQHHLLSNPCIQSCMQNHKLVPVGC